ncbi:hypothetical protein DPEC_G00149680 [Dallia pectoralis]|uniref:Uncharacterized protein n=1 Tax=Dallia pectoralis TaxID=75939 RepID=A0ACC2GIZ1_DALPE|nr:hypothetical protein DPEC_G00149680 [Dallia pectoralis]
MHFPHRAVCGASDPGRHACAMGLFRQIHHTERHSTRKRTGAVDKVTVVVETTALVRLPRCLGHMDHRDRRYPLENGPTFILMLQLSLPPP